MTWNKHRHTECGGDKHVFIMDIYTNVMPIKVEEEHRKLAKGHFNSQVKNKLKYHANKPPNNSIQNTA